MHTVSKYLEQWAEPEVVLSDDLGERYRSLQDVLPRLTVVGGCCGTDERHVAAVARAVTR